MKWGVRRANLQAARTQARVEKLKAKKKEQDKLLRAKTKVGKLSNEEAELKAKLKAGNDKLKSKGSSKKEEPQETKPKKEETKPSENKVENKPKAPRRMSEVSDDELKQIVTRMNMERQYKRMIEEDRQSVDTGKSAFKEWAGKTAKTILVDTAVSAGKRYMTNLLYDKADAAYEKHKKKSKSESKSEDKEPSFKTESKEKKSSADKEPSSSKSKTSSESRNPNIDDYINNMTKGWGSTDLIIYDDEKRKRG